MPDAQPTPTQTPQVTLISDNESIPPFFGTGSESVHAFVHRVAEECTRHSAHIDAEKLVIFNHASEPSSLAGKLEKCDKFLGFTTYDEFSTTLVKHFSSHS